MAHLKSLGVLIATSWLGLGSAWASPYEDDFEAPPISSCSVTWVGSLCPAGWSAFGPVPIAGVVQLEGQQGVDLDAPGTLAKHVTTGIQNEFLFTEWAVIPDGPAWVRTRIQQLNSQGAVVDTHTNQFFVNDRAKLVSSSYLTTQAARVELKVLSGTVHLASADPDFRPTGSKPGWQETEDTCDVLAFREETALITDCQGDGFTWYGPPLGNACEGEPSETGSQGCIITCTNHCFDMDRWLNFFPVPGEVVDPWPPQP